MTSEEACGRQLFLHILPHVLLCNRSEKVRIAFLRLLRRLDKIRGVQFYDITSVDNLLARLVLDSSRSTEATIICRLLVATFYPSVCEILCFVCL